MNRNNSIASRRAIGFVYAPGEPTSFRAAAHNEDEQLRMKDQGLTRAIEAAGGVGALARSLGISQPSVSNWSRIPAERVIAVEGATGVPRALLRPDLYPDDAIVAPAPLDDVDAARAQTYLMLAKLLRAAPDQGFLGRLAQLKGDSSPFGVALMVLADAAASVRPDALGNEFFALFVGVGRGEFLPYASYYLSGFLHERPLARVREDLAAYGVERAAGDYEPEDHVATLAEVMAGLIEGAFAAEAGAERAFFARHLEPWAGRFFADLEMTRTSAFYRAVGAVGRVFMDIEAEGFAIGS